MQTTIKFRLLTLVPLTLLERTKDLKRSGKNWGSEQSVAGGLRVE